MAAKAGQRAMADAATTGITNVQTQGVDEGGIVKQAGEHLVILRRGRLFTVRVGGDESATGGHARRLCTRAAIRVAPGTTSCWSRARPSWWWATATARGGTEIGLFELARDGALSYKRHLPPAQLRLLLVAQLRQPPGGRQADLLRADLAATLGQRARWDYVPGRCGAGAVWTVRCPRPFERILPATRVFRTDDDFDPTMPLAHCTR
jgi:hypothetical protein